MYKHIHTYIYTYTLYIHTYIHKYIHTYIHTHTLTHRHHSDSVKEMWLAFLNPPFFVPSPWGLPLRGYIRIVSVVAALLLSWKRWRRSYRPIELQREAKAHAQTGLDTPSSQSWVADPGDKSIMRLFVVWISWCVCVCVCARNIFLSSTNSNQSSRKL